MLPEGSRVRTRAEHARIGTAGRRTRSGPLVVHSLWTTEGGPARAGFVVGRRVGKAVVRNRVRRRLREQMRNRLERLSPGTMVVVRALPGAAAASSAELGAALDDALRRAARPDNAGRAVESHRPRPKRGDVARPVVPVAGAAGAPPPSQAGVGRRGDADGGSPP